MDNIDVCLEELCEETNLGISQSEEFEFTVPEAEAAKNELLITAKNNYITKSSHLTFEALDKPIIEIEDLSAPSNASYKDQFNISFTTAKKSNSNPINVTVLMTVDGRTMKWTLDYLDSDKPFTIIINASSLSQQNNLRVKADYEDELGRKYAVEQQFSIQLVNLSLFEKLMVFLNDLNKWLGSVRKV